MPELRDALREATNKIGVIAGNPQLIVFDAMLTSYPAITIAGPIGFGVNPANAFAGAAATIELIANGANVPTFAGITASGSWVNTVNAVNRIDFECLPSGAGSALAFYAKISQPTGSPAGVTSVAGKTGAVTLDKGDVGLGAVTNTADADKPISAATATALTNLSAATQPRDPDLTAIAGLPNSNGLIRKTSDGNATLQPISETGALSLAAANEAAGRSAVGWYGSRAVHLPGSAVALAGEAPIDFGISGLFDRSESTLIHLRGGSVTGTISGAGTLSGNLGALCDAESAAKIVATGCDATTEVSLTIDFGTNQPSYGRARWMPFVLFRSAIGGNTSTFGTIEVHGATEALPTTWVTADAGNWIDTNTAGSNQIAPGLWQAPEQIMRTTAFVYRYVRFTFKNYLPSTASPGTFWLAQIGFRHVAGRYARQFLLAAGDAAYGPISVRDASGVNIAKIGPGTLQINTGATLNWQSSVITVSLTGAATQLITVAVPGATGIFVRSTNARITGECTGTGANNVTIHNPAALTGTVSIILERYV